MKNLLATLLLGGIALLTLPAAQAQNEAQARPVAAFQAINVGSGIELTLTAGHEQRVAVSASTPELRDRILTSVEGGVLVIKMEQLGRGGWNNAMRNAQLRVAVTADQLTALTAGSGSSVRGTGGFAAASFQLDVSSGAAVKSDLTTDALVVRQSSGSTVSLSGRAPRCEVRVSSGATFDGEQLQTNHCQVEASSGSSVRVAVKDELSAQASSGASVSYRGQPQVSKSVSSGGSVSGR